MTKQDEIREGIADFCRVMRVEGELRHYTPQSDADGILEFLQDQGVVIKVDRELPKPNLSTVSLYCFKEGGAWIKPDVRAKMAIEEYGQDIRKAGYEAVEPLIKEDKVT